jgi:imidazolonepropionase-like amidohydrolase
LSGRLLLATTVAFRGATLIDGTGAAPVPDALLVVADGRIVYAGIATPEALDAIPPDAHTVSLAGKWIVPGLVDAHVHADSDADLRQMLRWGVTAVRLMAEDVVASQETARRAAAADSGMPDVVPSAPIFTVKGGWWGQDEPPDAHLDRFPSTPDAARAAVRKAKALGAREIKLMLDDTAWCRAPLPLLPKVDPAVERALIAEARRQGLRATVHAPGLADAEEAVAAHATALAHGVLEPLGEETIAKMKRRPVYYIPTMDVFEFLADTRGFVDGVLADPAATAAGALPPETVAKLRGAGYAAGYRARYPNFANLKRRLPALYDNLRRLHAAGVPVALGTDMWAFPGFAVSVEMDLFVRAGLTPLEAIRSATQTAARSLAIDGNYGTLEAGKRADFLVLDRDPLADVKNLRRIDGVYKQGTRVGPGPAPRGPSDGR